MKLLSFSLPGGYQINPAPGMPTGGIGKVEDIIQLGVTFLLVGAALLSLAFLIWGGIAWITSGGDKTGVEAARKKVTFAILGLVVAFLGFFIINFIGAFFGVKLIK